VTTLRVEVDTRAEALELCGRLGGFHCQLEVLDDERWVVTVRPDGDADRALAQVIDIVAAWVEQWSVPCVLEVDGRTYPLNPQPTAA
jgi:hypothetical protein